MLEHEGSAQRTSPEGLWDWSCETIVRVFCLSVCLSISPCPHEAPSSLTSPRSLPAVLCGHSLPLGWAGAYWDLDKISNYNESHAKLTGFPCGFLLPPHYSSPNSYRVPHRPAVCVLAWPNLSGIPSNLISSLSFQPIKLTLTYTIRAEKPMCSCYWLACLSLASCVWVIIIIALEISDN